MNKEIRGIKAKTEQLGMNPGTAANRLRKMLLFSLSQQTNNDICFHCNSRILTLEEFSIEHKIPWLGSDNPIEKFFDLSNIAFSHLKCNISSARKVNQKYFTVEDRKESKRKLNRESMKRMYTTEKRRIKQAKERSSRKEKQI